MSLVMAVPMEGRLVSQLLSSSQAFGDDVIDFHLILGAEEQTTGEAFPPLSLEQVRQCPSGHRVVPESLAPIE